MHEGNYCRLQAGEPKVTNRRGEEVTDRPGRPGADGGVQEAGPVVAVL